jgi:hypothetical protein
MLRTKECTVGALNADLSARVVDSNLYEGGPQSQWRGLHQSRLLKPLGDTCTGRVLCVGRHWTTWQRLHRNWQRRGGSWRRKSWGGWPAQFPRWCDWGCRGNLCIERTQSTLFLLLRRALEGICAFSPLVFVWCRCKGVRLAEATGPGHRALLSETERPPP